APARAIAGLGRAIVFVGRAVRRAHPVGEVVVGEVAGVEQRRAGGGLALAIGAGPTGIVEGLVGAAVEGLAIERALLEVPSLAGAAVVVPVGALTLVGDVLVRRHLAVDIDAVAADLDGVAAE